MEIDHQVIDEWKNAERVVKGALRVFDIVLVPTSIVRTVMRREDAHLAVRNWLKEHDQKRYEDSSSARWTYPIALTMAGIPETARLGTYLYGAYELGSRFF